jgi:16S rRNA (cytosine967-C5)-methyltransferase
MSTGLPARRAALAAVASVEVDGAWSNLAVPEAVADLPDAKDRAFASHLAYDLLRWQGTLDWALGHVLTRSLDEVEPALRRVLRLGALQLLRSGVPSRAAVDTSVSLAREQVPPQRAKGAGGFVNGVLRALDRRRGELPWPDPDDDAVGRLVLDHGHPRWIVSELHVRFGYERTAEILDGDNQPPGLTLRATGDRDALVAELVAEGLDASAGALAMSVRVPGADPRRLVAVAEGRAVPQDEASMRVVEACAVMPGDRVLDLCAGPGGKATALAGATGPDGEVVAVELHAHRARMVAAAAARQGVEVDVRVGDATRPLSAAVPLERAATDPFAESFDVVVLDAPCTGLGTGRRRPEIRWRRRPEDVGELAALQRRLLETAVAAARPGGRIVYSVCTWTLEETERMADHLDVAHASELRAVSRRQLWPDRDDTDGMFVAVWERGPAG